MADPHVWRSDARGARLHSQLPPKGRGVPWVDARQVIRLLHLVLCDGLSGCQAATRGDDDYFIPQEDLSA